MRMRGGINSPSNVLIFCAQFARREMSWVSIGHCVVFVCFESVNEMNGLGMFNIEGWMFRSTFLP